MPERLWSLNDLARFLRFEDPEVRYWAADRLGRHYTREATDLLAPYLFDEHDLTPELVAAHLGKHGGAAHLPVLARGVKTLRGLPAARALEALIRLRAPEALEAVKEAFDRRDFEEECWSYILDALAERGDAPARRELLAFLKRRADWVGSPAILASALHVTEPGEYRALLLAWIRSLQWKGASGGDTGEAFRVLMDHLQVDDCGWCFRTNLSGRIDFERTLKAIESAYNCELRAALGEPSVRAIASALEAGAFEDSAATLARTVKERARDVRSAPGDDLADRIVEVAVSWADAEIVGLVEGLGPHLREWVIGFLIAAVVKMARYRNYELEVRRSAADLDALAGLLEEETSFLLDSLPQAIRKAIEASGEAGAPGRSQARRRVEDRCLAILAARGPFFPQGMALETLGELRSVGAVNEILDFLTEENSYLYEAAEHALAKLDAAVIDPARARLAAGNVEEDSGHSLLITLCEVGTPEALKLVLEHLEFFVDAAGPGNSARWISLLGSRELIDPLRRHLPKDTAQVGQAILLLAAIHNTRVPEEAAIRQAIDDFWKKHPEEGEDGEDPGPGDGSDKYLM
jgi:HEAT repeat protein